MKKVDVKGLVRLAVVAAVYVVVTLAGSWMAYGPVQFRVAEMLMLLCFYRRDYVYSLVLGCGIANLFSPMAALDVPFGTGATLLAALGIVFLARNLWAASLFPVILNGIIVGIELNVAFNEPLLLSMGTVALGELVVVTVVGVPVFKLLERNAYIKNRILLAQS